MDAQFLTLDGVRSAADQQCLRALVPNIVRVPLSLLPPHTKYGLALHRVLDFLALLFLLDFESPSSLATSASVRVEVERPL